MCSEKICRGHFKNLNRKVIAIDFRTHIIVSGSSKNPNMGFEDRRGETYIQCHFCWLLCRRSSSDKTIRIWDLHKEVMEHLKGHDNTVSSVNFSPDGIRILLTRQSECEDRWKGETSQGAYRRHTCSRWDPHRVWFFGHNNPNMGCKDRNLSKGASLQIEPASWRGGYGAKLGGLSLIYLFMVRLAVAMILSESLLRAQTSISWSHLCQVNWRRAW